MKNLNEIEHNALTELLKGSAENTTQSLNKFTNWLAVSLSAAIVLIISNIDKVGAYFDLDKIKISIYLLLLSIFLLIIQKYLAVINSAFLLQIDLEDKLESKYREDKSYIDFQRYYDAIEASHVWYLKWIFKLRRKKKNSYLPRTAFKLSSVQGTMVLVQLLLILTSLTIITFSIKA